MCRTIRRQNSTDIDAEFDRYNREDPKVGIKEITTGFRKWAERYLSHCEIHNALVKETTASKSRE